jgi:hypothetical protein
MREILRTFFNDCTLDQLNYGLLLASPTVPASHRKFTNLAWSPNRTGRHTVDIRVTCSEADDLIHAAARNNIHVPGHPAVRVYIERVRVARSHRCPTAGNNKAAHPRADAGGVGLPAGGYPAFVAPLSIDGDSPDILRATAKRCRESDSGSDACDADRNNKPLTRCGDAGVLPTPVGAAVIDAAAGELPPYGSSSSSGASSGGPDDLHAEEPGELLITTFGLHRSASALRPADEPGGEALDDDLIDPSAAQLPMGEQASARDSPSLEPTWAADAAQQAREFEAALAAAAEQNELLRGTIAQVTAERDDLRDAAEVDQKTIDSLTRLSAGNAGVDAECSRLRTEIKHLREVAAMERRITAALDVNLIMLQLMDPKTHTVTVQAVRSAVLTTRGGAFKAEDFPLCGAQETLPWKLTQLAAGAAFSLKVPRERAVSLTPLNASTAIAEFDATP